MFFMVRARWSAALWLSVGFCAAAWAYCPTAARGAEPPGPPYPRVNLATCYEVDARWPQRPAGVEWGHVPGVAVSPKDEVYVFTRAKPPVQVYDTGGKLLRSWGDAEIAVAHYLKFDPQGNVWVADVGNHVVMQFTPGGKLLKTLGTRGAPGEDATHLNKPTDMAVTPEGEVFVTDGYGNNRVVHFDRAGKFVKAWGKLGIGPGEFSLPHAIVRDSQGNLYVADRNNVRIQVFDSQGKFLQQWRNLLVPWGLTITKNDELWVCGSSPMPWAPGPNLLSCPPKDQVVMKFATSGKLLQLWTIPKGEDGHERPGEVNWLHTVAEDSQGNLYVGDITGMRAQKLVRQK
jgi:DNA-binding beta-propeller fold protein YncE